MATHAISDDKKSIVYTQKITIFIVGSFTTNVTLRPRTQADHKKAPIVLLKHLRVKPIVLIMD
jgi:hypothetical protein